MDGPDQTVTCGPAGRHPPRSRSCRAVDHRPVRTAGLCAHPRRQPALGDRADVLRLQGAWLRGREHPPPARRSLGTSAADYDASGHCQVGVRSAAFRVMLFPVEGMNVICVLLAGFKQQKLAQRLRLLRELDGAPK